MAQPDLRTLAGATQFLSYHAPDEDTIDKHQQVRNSFEELITNI